MGVFVALVRSVGCLEAFKHLKERGDCITIAEFENGCHPLLRVLEEM